MAAICCPRISSVLQQQLGHGLMATSSSSMLCKCCPLPPHRPCCSTAGPRPHGHLQAPAVEPSCLAALTSAPCCSSSWATASWPPSSHINAVAHIGTVLQQQLGHGLMATSSSIINAVPPHRPSCIAALAHRHRAVAAAGPRPHGHLQQHTSML